MGAKHHGRVLVLARRPPGCNPVDGCAAIPRTDSAEDRNAITGGTIPDLQAFVDAFYRTQRARLETDLAIGKRRSDKQDTVG